MKYSLITLIVLTASLLTGQASLNPCGTAPVKSPWLTKYQANPTAYDTKHADLLYVPLAINIVAGDQGQSMINEAKLYASILQLNEDFADSDMQFFLRAPIDYIFSTEWANHQDVLTGADMMFANNIEDAINCYFCPVAANNCGYNLPYAGVAVANNCSGEDDHTWAHEIGHNLSLPHPFLGWEGNVDCGNLRDWLTPAQTSNTYDYTYFQDTLIRDTLIIDTALVELVDRSNCLIAADGFCDTPPDYLPCRWTCNGDGSSPVTQIDPDGVAFNSDGSLIMSYSLDACQARFSQDQTSAMRANLVDQKPGHLNNTDRPADIVEGTPTPITPVGGVEVNAAEVYLEWEAVPNAMYYLVEASFREAFTSYQFDTIVSGTSCTASFDRLLDRTFYWRVRPFTSHQFDYEYGPLGTFVPTEISVDTDDTIIADMMSIANTLVTGGSITITSTRDLDIMVVNTGGSAVYKTGVDAGSNTIALDHLPPGIYVVTATDGRHQQSSRIVIP